MTIDELRALISTADGERQVLALDQASDEPHREVAVEIDTDGDLIITVLSW